MTVIDPGAARELLESIIAAFSVLGGGMAYFSGYYATQALSRHQPPALVAQRINEGISEGFRAMSPLSILALIIVVWS